MTPRWMKHLWDGFCFFSLVGIYPRFIEPNRLTVSYLKLSHPLLKNLKIVQFSDLHFSHRTSSHFLNKLSRTINQEQGDLVVFTGDFLCNSVVEDEERLVLFLNSIKAPHCLAIVGNHDYNTPIGINSEGNYDTLSKKPELIQGLIRLFTSLSPTKIVTPSAKNAMIHSSLSNLLTKTPFNLLHNQSTTLSYNNCTFNVVGLAEYMTGQITPHAFDGINPSYPTLVLLHNPDGVPSIDSCPGDLILSGHTHGGQLNLPWFWKRFTLLENFTFKSGLKNVSNKKLYINRGVGSSFPFRLFSPPEVTVIHYD